jgi:putative membrane protein (TIGR04086 family)
MLDHTMMVKKSSKKKGSMLMNPIQRVNPTRISSPLLSGLVYALSFMTAGLLLISLILFFTSTQEQSLPALTTILHAVSLFIGGWVTGKRSESRGWYHGGMLSVFYSTILFIVSFLAYDASLNLHSLRLLVLLVAVGALGGILGVNSRK